MAATQTMSPGGALLRASRMFAMPKPLPTPQAQVLGAGLSFRSNTATLPYPTHLSITTPPSSLSRGDWGLKRPLPLRSTTRTSTPILRISTMDTYEHITEYASAADHSLTLKKWQDLHLSMMTPKDKANVVLDADKEKIERKSVFEKDLDYTVRREMDIGEQDPRWKFNGPWLPGQTELEFSEYVKKEVRRRRLEFNDLLRKECATFLTSKAVEEARNSSSNAPEPMVASDITDEQFSVYVKGLRQDRVKLFTLIRQFLDLPPTSKISDSAINVDEWFPGKQIDIKRDTDTQSKRDSPYAKGGPPKTHPSAGISYLRTSAHIENHPLFGPQRSKAPFYGRIVMPKGSSKRSVAKLGVAGVVTSVPSDAEGGFRLDTLNRNSRTRGRPAASEMDLDYVNINLRGGGKAWVTATAASISPRGTVQLEVAKASEMSVVIAKGKAWQAPPVEEGTTWEVRERRPPSKIHRFINPFGVPKESPADMLEGMVKPPE